MALTGSLILLFEFLNYRGGGSAGYHAASACSCSSSCPPSYAGPPWGRKPFARSVSTVLRFRAIQHSKRLRCANDCVAPAGSWRGRHARCTGRLNNHAVQHGRPCAFSPAILAYGRILGSSWHALKQSSEKSPKARHRPSTITPQRTAAICRSSRPFQPHRHAVCCCEHVDFAGVTCTTRMFVIPNVRISPSIGFSPHMEEGGLLVLV